MRAQVQIHTLTDLSFTNGSCVIRDRHSTISKRAKYQIWTDQNRGCIHFSLNLLNKVDVWLLCDHAFISWTHYLLSLVCFSSRHTHSSAHSISPTPTLLSQVTAFAFAIEFISVDVYCLSSSELCWAPSRMLYAGDEGSTQLGHINLTAGSSKVRSNVTLV